MEVMVAKTAGFCFGVKRAVDQVKRQIAEGRKPIYTYGPIIHNEEVVRELAGQGVRVIESEKELPDITDGTVVIRSQGVPERIYREIKDQGLEIVDATCPFVKKKEELLQPDVQTQAQPAAQSTYSTGGWTAAPKWKRLWQTPATAPASR